MFTVLPDAAELDAAELAALLAADEAALLPDAAAEEAALDAALDAAEDAALLGALVAAPDELEAADVVLPDALPLLELQAASAAPAAITEPTWKKRRRFNRDKVGDSSGSVIDVPFHLGRSL
jgi:hypothetical protein